MQIRFLHFNDEKEKIALLKRVNDSTYHIESVNIDYIVYTKDHPSEIRFRKGQYSYSMQLAESEVSTIDIGSTIDIKKQNTIEISTEKEIIITSILYDGLCILSLSCSDLLIIKI